MSMDFGDFYVIMVQRKEEERWYVMRVYKNEKQAEELLSSKDGLEYYIPKEEVVRTRHGKKIICKVPVIPSLVFVHATHSQIIAFKLQRYNRLQFVLWSRDGNSSYLTVPDNQMNSFIQVCEQEQKKVTFYKPGEIHLEEGVKVRVHGGALDNVEGTFVKVAGKRSRQVVVLLVGVMAVSAEVEPEYLQIIG